MSADLGALVASPHFRFMDGMRDSYGRTLRDFGGPGLRWIGGHSNGAKAYTWPLVPEPPVKFPNPLPDLDDPATLGCLLHLVREAWGDQTIFLEPATGHDGAVVWRVCAWRHTASWRLLRVLYKDERDGLVAALLAAPPKTEVKS